MLGDPHGQLILGYPSSDDYLLHSTELSAVILVSLKYVTFFQVGIIVLDSFNKLGIISFS